MYTSDKNWDLELSKKTKYNTTSKTTADAATFKLINVNTKEQVEKLIKVCTQTSVTTKDSIDVDMLKNLDTGETTIFCPEKK